MYDHFCREPILTSLQEVNGKQRHRRYTYQANLDILTRDTTTGVGATFHSGKFES